MQSTCNFFWGSHGCSLPAGDHTIHQCFYPWGEIPRVNCCEYDEAASPDLRIRHNRSADENPTVWGTWSPYGDGWRQ